MGLLAVLNIRFLRASACRLSIGQSAEFVKTARAVPPNRTEGIKFDKFRKQNCLHNAVDKTVETVHNSDFTGVSGG